MRLWWFRSPGLVAALFMLFTAFPSAAADCWVRDLATPRPGEVWLLCEQGRIRISRDAGRSWRDQTLQPPDGWRALAAGPDGYAVAAGAAGRIAWTADGGQTWNRVDTAAAGADLHAAATAAGRFWVAGDEGFILHSPDGGATWARQRTFTTARLEGLFFLDENRGWAVGWAGTILRTTDGGRFWETVAADDVYGNLTAVWFEDADTGWAAGAPGLVLRTGDGGRTWTRVAAPVTGLVRSIRVSAGAGIMAGDRLLVRNAEGRWEPVAWLPPEAFTAASLANGELWAAGPHFLARSRDGGRSWMPVWRESGLPETGFPGAGRPGEAGERTVSAMGCNNLLVGD